MDNNETDNKIRHKFQDESVWQRLNQAISVGAYIEDACVFAGISSRQYRRWRDLAEQGIQPYADRWKDINQSEAQSVIRNLINIQNSANNGSWQASAWILERKYPERFGRRDYLALQQQSNDFDVILHWSDGKQFIEGEEVASEMSDIKKEKEDE